MYFNNINELSLITNVIFIINELYVCVYITCVCVCVCVYAYIQCNISQEKNKILPFAITLLDVEDIMLSEIS